MSRIIPETRAGRPEDAESILQNCFPRDLDLVVQDAVRNEWLTFLRPEMPALILEDRQGNTPIFLGVCQLIFVRDEFVCSIGAGANPNPNPLPWVNAQAARLMPNGQSPLLSIEEIDAANQADGLNAMIVRWMAASTKFHNEAEILNMIWSRMEKYFADYSRRYNYKEFIAEVIGDDTRVRTELAGFNIRQEYRNFYDLDKSKKSRPYLMGLKRDEVCDKRGSVAANLFDYYINPIFYFSSVEKKILRLAISGKTDAQVCEALNIPITTVKMHMRNIYKNVGSVRQGLISLEKLNGKATRDNGKATRDTEKKRCLITYLKDHQEELVPY